MSTKFELPQSPVFPTRVSREGIDTRTHLVEAAFITLRNGLAMFSALRRELIPAELPELADFNSCLRSRDKDKFEATHIAPASNGYALSKLTRGGLADFSVRLKVPTDGSEPEFHREAFNVDEQCLSPRPTNLTGLREIRGDANAIVEILSFERDIVYASMTNWESFVQGNTRAVRC